MNKIEKILKQLPDSPGVYIMRGKEGGILYIGKAKSLRKRVRQYFRASGDDRAFIPLLDAMLGDIEVVITANEKEALILEGELIRKFKPRFNVEMRYDRRYLYIRLDRTKEFPRFELVRRRKKDSATYFGPFHSALALRNTFDLVNRHFGLRTCSEAYMRHRTRPCIEYQIQRCSAPCVFPIGKEYGRSVGEAVKFLTGKGREVAGLFRERMNREAGEMNFEEAARLRDAIQAIESALTPQNVVFRKVRNVDVFGFCRDSERCAVSVMRFAEGVMTDYRNIFIKAYALPDEEAMTGALFNFYHTLKGEEIPPEVVIPFGIEMSAGITDLLKGKRGKGVNLVVPARGEYKRALAIAGMNAREFLTGKEEEEEGAGRLLCELRERLNLKNLPSRMECFDISVMQGSFPVGAMAVFRDGAPDRGEYRLFNIKGDYTRDDFSMIAEVVRRRVRRGAEEKNLPDLMVIDGGIGQLNAAVEAVRSEGFGNAFDIISIVKGVKPFPDRILKAGGEEAPLDDNSPLLHLIMRLRDEAHRFAVTRHRRKREEMIF